MATAYLTPGVYVEEMPPGSRPIEGVGTSVAAFIGFAEMGPRNRPVLITNWSQYLNTFGGFVDGYYLPHSVYGYFANGGGTAYVVNLAPSQAPQALIPPAEGQAGANGKPALEFYATKQGLTTPGVTIEVSFDNAGALPAPVKEGEKPEKVEKGEPGPKAPFSVSVKRGDTVIEKFEKVTLDRESPKYVETAVNGVSQFVWVNPVGGKAPLAPTSGSFELAKPAATALAVTGAEVQGDPRERSGIAGLAAIDEITIVCAPDLMSMYKSGLIDDQALVGLQKAILTHCELQRDRVAILDCPPGLDPQEMSEWRDASLMDSAYGTLYYPWIKVLDPLDVTGKRLLAIPPSGHMAGIWARTDSERGVHKAPANEVVRGAVDLGSQVTDGEQGILNPKGVNCIRAFGTRGIRVWGARTISSDAAWKYINVRRFFNWVEDSIQHGTQWAVFEPNDFGLWQRLKRDINSFLLRPYRDGALFGATPEQAFYVKCDNETNPPDQIDAGMVVVEIGMCPVKPAEFVIFRVTQLATGG
jgi:phage tail sheath protein FI